MRASAPSAAHRGGTPELVHVVDERTLLFPDYLGNNMFNTFGNLAADPRAGLLFLDFGTGATLQLTGRAEVLWDNPERQPFAGAQRVVRFDLDRGVQIANAVPLRWAFREYSRLNPVEILSA